MRILLEIFLVAMLALGVWRLIGEPWKGRILNVLKAWVTIRAFWLLLAHPVTLEDGSQVVAGRLILDQLQTIDAGTFWFFLAIAAGLKFIGILASMYRWITLLRGQGIELPFRHIFGSFLIGRFIGTFLPSTAGLDGYKLYDASRFSGRTVEATAATLIEKVIGFSGIFLSFLVALPFGKHIFDATLGENANFVAGLAVLISSALIGGLMMALFYPGVIQWFLRVLPLPGKAQLEGFVTRISNAASAYRHKRQLIVLAFALSFVVHFTTAAMYYFTARAIGAGGAQFWAIVFGSSIQIFATVISPFTIAGEGIREAAQYVLLGHMIGPAAAIVSAALGFWAAEALTLFGGVFWWIRRSDYRPEYCLVNGEQVDYDRAAEAALELDDPEESGARAARAGVPDLTARLRASASYGLGAGLLSGLLIGLIESSVIAAAGFAVDAQVLWYGPLAYAVVLGGLGLAGGAALAILPMTREEIQGWVPSLAMIALLVPMGLAITLFRLRRDVYLEQMPPAPVLAAVLGGAVLLALLLFFGGRRLFAGPAGRIAQAPVAAALTAAVFALGLIAAAVAGPEVAAPPTARAIPPELADRPNVILVMVDTLRADHLSCYDESRPATPNLCAIAKGGTIFDGHSHASWTKPATASLLSATLPSSHGAMSKPAALSSEVELISESLQNAGYATGGIVSNINLAPSFGFDQGYDEYHYLGPDYIAGAGESSSKLILYQIARSVWFKLKSGHSVGDFYQPADRVNAVAFDWLERHKDSRFFLFLHYMDPHDPYFAHPHDGHAIARVENAHPDESLAEEMKSLYSGEIAFLDSEFARLLEKLRAMGVYENTVIALTADHGEEFYEHGGWWHGLTLYDEQVRVPLLMKWANGSASAPRNARGHLARHIDVAPTLLARAGVPVPESMQGTDLAANLAARPEHQALGFSEEDHEGNVLRAVRSRSWKWLEANEGNPRGLPTTELFDLARDPGETQSLHEQQASVVERLKSHADAQVEIALGQATGGGEATQLSAQEEDALRALGYIE